MAVENSWRTYEIKKCFLEIFKLSELQIIWSSLFYLITGVRRKEFWQKFCSTLNTRILLVFRVLQVLAELGIVLNRYFGQWYLKILQKHSSFMYNLIVSRVSKSSSLFSFSLEILLIASAIANAVDSSFCWSVALTFLSYMKSPYSR